MSLNRKAVWASLALQVIVWSGVKPTPEQSAAILAGGPGKTNYSENLRLPEGVVGEPLKGETYVDLLRSRPYYFGVAGLVRAGGWVGPSTAGAVSGLRLQASRIRRAR